MSPVPSPFYIQTTCLHKKKKENKIKQENNIRRKRKNEKYSCSMGHRNFTISHFMHAMPMKQFFFLIFIRSYVFSFRFVCMAVSFFFYPRVPSFDSKTFLICCSLLSNGCVRILCQSIDMQRKRKSIAIVVVGAVVIVVNDLCFLNHF